MKGPEDIFQTGQAGALRAPLSRESDIIQKFLKLREDANSVGLTLIARDGEIVMHDLPGHEGVLRFSSISEVETFIYGYESAYEAGLNNE